MAYETKDITQLPVQTHTNFNSRFIGGFLNSEDLVVYTAESIDDIIPDKATEIQVFSTGGIADITLEEENSIQKGAIVVLNNGTMLMYKGSGSKVDKTNYISLNDAGEW